MGTALQKAISLILSSDAELLNILKVTAQMSLKSSLLALLLGVPLGICLGNSKFPGRGLLIILNRTLELMGNIRDKVRMQCFRTI